MSRFQNSINDININTPITTTATSYTALITDYIIEVTSTAAARVITLPAPSLVGASPNPGKIFIIQDTSGAAATNNISLTPASGLIDGGATVAINVNYGCATVFCDGSAYYVISNTVAAGGGAGITWNAVSGTTQAIVVNNGYYTTGASLCTLTLPATAVAGSVVEVAGSGAGLWVIAQNAGQQIIMGNQSTTAGTGGSLASTLKGDSVRMLATTGGSSTIWQVLDSFGNITVT
jgi:hypothetical protein